MQTDADLSMSWFDDAGEGWTAAAVSPQLRRNVDEMGPDAKRWLDSVPELVAAVADTWDLDVGAPVSNEGHVSVVLAARTADGTDAILKLSLPDEESRPESAALRRWDGHGAVRILRASDQGFTLLLERCRPGQDLLTVAIPEQVETLTDLFPRLWLEPDSPNDTYPELVDTAARWQREMMSTAARLGVAREIAEDARRWARELGDDMPRRLLHGDLHPQNVLSAEGEPWLAIDPKPWIGDPAFDLAQTLVNWVRAGPEDPDIATAHARRHAATMSNALDLEPDRVLRWAVVKGIGWEFAPSETTILHRAATSL